MSHSAKLLIAISLLAILFSLTPVALAAAGNATYKPAHWSGLVRKYDAAGQAIGWTWGGGLRKTGSGLVWAVDLFGHHRDYMVMTGTCYGCVQ